METKKNREKNVENLRISLIFSGLLFTGGLVLASFTYSTPFGEKLEEQVVISQNDVNYVQETKQVDTPDQPEEQPEYVAPPQPIIRIDSNINTPPTPIITPPNPPVIVIDPTPIVVAAPVEEWPDVEAEFPGGTAELHKWIGNNIVYPEISIQMEEQGKVYLSFVVEANGDISGVEIERGVSKELDREAKRIMRNMPQWIPGEVDGRRVRTRCRLPIVFTLQ